MTPNSQKLLLTLFCLLFTCEILGQSQHTSDIDSLSFQTIDTVEILKASWEKIKNLNPIEDSSQINSLLKKYQTLSHEYGFRFENEFNNRRLHFSYHQLFDELAILEDKNGSLSIETISHPDYQNKFKRNDSDKNINREIVNIFPIPDNYNPHSVYWVKFNATNLNEVEEEAWFMVGWIERSWEEIEIYKDNGTTVQKVGNSGLRTPTDKKTVDDWRNLIQIKVPPKSQHTYYLRLEGLFFPKYPDRISLYHYDEKVYWKQKSLALFEDGVFLGITFLLLLIVSVLYYYGRDKDTLYFAILLIGIWLYEFADSENIGSSNFYSELFPGALESGQVIAIIGFIMMLYGGVFFTLSFLKTKDFAPKIRKLIILIFNLSITGYIILATFNVVLHPFFEYPSGFKWITNYMFSMLLLISLFPILVLVISVIAWKKKHPLARIFIICYLPLVVSSFAGAIGEAVFDISLSSNHFNMALRIGHFATYFLFTIAIFNKRQKEKDEILKKRLELSHQLNQEQQEANRLKELDTFKGKLYTNITHEFRTPLTVIIGMAEQIRSKPKKYLEQGTRLIESNGKNLLQLINQLLDLSKLENKSLQLNLQQSDIIPYLRYLAESFHTYANSKNLSLQFFTTEESLIMDYDIEQTKQILTNLISNAVKYTPNDGEVIIRVSKNHSFLTLEIKDNGIGISDKDLLNIFDRFYQVDSSMTRKGGGTGIGLAHTRELVHLMNGKIEIQSSIGRGTSVFVNLPIQRKAKIIKNVEAKENGFSNSPTKKNNSNYLQNSTKEHKKFPQLLIVEDNPDVVIYLKTCLHDNYQIDVAYNGKIGIEKALENIPDIIISDVMMPEKNGYEVCDFLKNDERTSHIPIILLTAKSDIPSKIQGLKKGADVYLSKPFNKEELLIRLENLMKRQKRMIAYFSKQKIFFSNYQADKVIEDNIQLEHVFIQKVKNIIEENYSDDTFTLSVLCQKLKMSRSQLFRKMKATIGTSPSEFIRKYRLEKAKLLFETTPMNISEVAWKVGFKDPSHFSKAYQKEFGHSPNTTDK